MTQFEQTKYCICKCTLSYFSVQTDMLVFFFVNSLRLAGTHFTFLQKHVQQHTTASHKLSLSFSGVAGNKSHEIATELDSYKCLQICDNPSSFIFYACV